MYVNLFRHHLYIYMFGNSFLYIKTKLWKLFFKYLFVNFNLDSTELNVPKYEHFKVCVHIKLGHHGEC